MSISKKSLVVLTLTALAFGTSIVEASAKRDYNANNHKSNLSKQHRSAAIKPYLANLKMNIAGLWSPPPGKASTWGVVYFELNEKGYTQKLEVVKSSKDQEIDRTFLLAIERATPFGVLPSKNKVLPVRVAFHYYPEHQSTSVVSRQYEDQVEFLDGLSQVTSREGKNGEVKVYSTICTFIDSNSRRNFER